MQDKEPEPEFINSSATVDLTDVIKHYVKDYKVNGNPVLVYEWGINPATNRVVFTFISKKEVTV